LERIGPATIFPVRMPLIGMLHAPPLPGAPAWGGDLEAVLERVLQDAERLRAGGVDGLLLENYGDVPFHADAVPPETVAALAVLAREVRRAAPLPLGVNVLRNDAAAALAVAAAAGAAFIRVNVHSGAMLTDQGWIQGRADATLRRRATLRVPVMIAADVFVKHAVPPAGLELAQAARDTWERARAEVLILSGAGTGEATPVERLAQVRAALPDAPLWIGSGLTPENAPALLPHADGAIVGSTLQRDGRAGASVERERVARLVDVVSRLR
jgi:hypothetical protein